MPSLYLLIPIAVLLVLIASLLYCWAVNNGQYSDLDREANRILFDNNETNNVPKPKAQKQC